MHVLVTGVHGFSGRHVVRKILNAGHQVTGIGGRNKDKPGMLQDDFEVICGNIADGLALPCTIDAIVHIAASSPSAERPFSASELFRDNVLATDCLARYAADAGARKFIYFSSMSIYGDISVPEVDVDTPIVNPDTYGISKYMGEALIADFSSTYSSLAIRLPGVIGPGAVRNWLSSVLAKAKAGDEINFFNAEADFNNAAHVNDISDMVCTCLNSTWQGHHAVTIGANGVLPVKDVVNKLIAGCGGHSKAQIAGGKNHPFIISSKKAISRFGYRPMGISEMLDRFIAENHPS